MSAERKRAVLYNFVYGLLHSHFEDVIFSADRKPLACEFVVVGMGQVQLSIIGLTVAYYPSSYAHLRLDYNLYRFHFNRPTVY